MSNDLAASLSSLAPSGVLIGHRFVAAGDEDTLLPSEIGTLGASAMRRRQSGAARIVARALLQKLGSPEAALRRSPTGAPNWPSGFIGSLSHDQSVAVAAVTRAESFDCIGVDVEPADELPPELVPIVASEQELNRYSEAILHSRLLFVIKEAVYKAVSRFYGEDLNFHGIAVDLDARQAVVRGVRRLDFSFTTEPRVVALACMRRSDQCASGWQAQPDS